MKAITATAKHGQLLGQRLGEIARILLAGGSAIGNVPVSVLLDELTESVRLNPGEGRLWLLFAAVAGAYPTPEQHEALRRRLAIAEPGEATPIVLDGTVGAASTAGDWDRPLRVAESAVLVDVNFCAKFVHNTGIQRVVREVMPHLVALGGTNIELVAWTMRSGITRSLTAVERQRVVDWRAVVAGDSKVEPAGPGELIIPWRSRILLPEVPGSALCERLAGLAQYSGSTVAVIGYDMIPTVSADLVLPTESEHFARFLGVVKHVTDVVAISESVASEFDGFAEALSAQGLPRPRVTCVPLAAEVPPHDPDESAVEDIPLVLAVGSHEPRKNQAAVLFAVETLLREGLDFRAVFVGGGNRTRTLAFDRRLRRLRAQHGWQIESIRGMKDRELWQNFARARFSVFVSLHEGYGLPVVESLALGTPVLTANYGSLAEIAADGGCLVVDPRSDDEIIAAMRRLLTDDELISSLASEAASRPPRTWRNYATELWAAARLGERT
jgi:glycosyltransferase involved in cell wall biosynthesis